MWWRGERGEERGGAFNCPLSIQLSCPCSWRHSRPTFHQFKPQWWLPQAACVHHRPRRPSRLILGLICSSFLRLCSKSKKCLRNSQSRRRLYPFGLLFAVKSFQQFPDSVAKMRYILKKSHLWKTEWAKWCSVELSRQHRHHSLCEWVGEPWPALHTLNKFTTQAKCQQGDKKCKYH